MRRPFKRKSQLQRLLGKLSLPYRPSSKTVKVGAITAGGLAGLTAGSAGISSLRRRAEGAEDDS
jgi:hypothetical protein